MMPGLLRELVALDTASPMAPPALDAAGRFLARWGLRKSDDGPFWLRRRPGTDVWIYSHIDTKPAGDAGAWGSAPLVLTRSGARLVGLGVSDAKFQLLNALRAGSEFGLNILVDGGEECGDLSAARFLAAQDCGVLVLADGSGTDGQTFCGTMGQMDGEIAIASGLKPVHPGRARRVHIAKQLGELLQDMRADGSRINLTGLGAPVTERSLTTEACSVRFDLRYGPADQPAADAFTAKWDARLRQHYAPLGRDDARFGPRAAFSSPMGSVLGTDVAVVVVPGGRPDNGNHQPDEWIDAAQIQLHDELLRRVLAALAGEAHAAA
ncbi:MAG: M20/M25/M40 family metallo-hydrolase [Pseudomonadota bacterium]